LEIKQALWEGELVARKTEGSVRTIFLGPALLMALRVQKQNSKWIKPEDFVFCKSDGARLNPDVLRCDVLYPVLDRSLPRVLLFGIPHLPTLGCHHCQSENWKPETRSTTARAFESEHNR
jgi:hypothetical protein